MKAVLKTRTYPVQDRRPPFHGDALEHREHGEPDVVERRDPVVRPLPPLQTDRVAVPAPVAALGPRLRLVVRVARHFGVPLLRDLI